MHIEEVIIEGFKSYATRTVVRGFDLEFNAITGLNGSGKSNILDSICFVLGITNLSAVRAANLTDLVYKQGQAGVTKASVCVVFDNGDPQRSPVGYEDAKKIAVTREVVVGGRNRYVVNGHSKTAAQVANMFHSVQLNVNNPHFLIMQGRITKVLNMKPPEILSMVEEAAGTRMFETKKADALKTLHKKQTKVEEIERVLHDDIVPTLERLRGEKAQYLQYSAAEAECAKLKRFCAAANYVEASTELEKASTEAAAAAASEVELTAAAEACEATSAELKEREDAARSADGAAGKAAKRRKNLADQEAVKAKAVVQAQAEVAAAEQALEADDEAVAGQRQADADFEAAAAALGRSLAEAAALVAKRTGDRDEARTRADAAERAHRAACAGVDDDQDQGGGGRASTKSAAEQLAEARDAVKCAKAKGGQAAKEAAALKKRRAATAREAQAAAGAVAKLDAALDEARGAERAARDALKKAGGLPEDEEEEAAAAEGSSSSKDNARNNNNNRGDAFAATRRAAVSRLKAEKRAALERCEKLEAQLRARLAFDFADPGGGFDRGKVRGVLAKLVCPKEVRDCAALEVVAGGRLYQVVVEDEQTGKALLERGKLQRRVTLVPLSKVQSRPVAEAKAAKAKAVAAQRGGFASVAIELVGFGADVKAAVAYAFGSTLVCDSLDTARDVAFHREVRTKCVTLAGDVCNPAGTLTGGSSNAGLGATLARLHNLNASKEAVAKLAAELAEAEGACEAAERDAARLATLERAWSLAKAAADTAEAKRKACAAGVAADALDALDRDCDRAERDARDAVDEEKAARDLVATIEADGDAVEKRRAQELARREKAAKATADALRKAQGKVDEAVAKHRDLEAEVEALQGERASAESHADRFDRAKEASQVTVDKARKALEGALEALEAIRATVEAARADLDEAEAEARSLAKDRAASDAKATSARLEAKKLSHVAARLAKDWASWARRVEALLQDHEWIQGERRFFGTAGSDYDFDARPVPDAQRRLKALAATQASLAKKVNKRVMGMIEKAEREYDDLRHKKDVVTKDRKTIERVIADLETKKRDTLVLTCAKVDRDFGAIFASLLPGTQAKLQPPEGCDVLEGLEVRVAFGTIWKDSLSELSGGQRSLIALSLVLAMLKFKPAPMYILDEVDAALDLSHTQNIGRMLRAHFKTSQFIVVSLKEGMFNNANVIFRTKFVDGVSTVQRTVTQHHLENGKSSSAPKKKGTEA